MRLVHLILLTALPALTQTLVDPAKIPGLLRFDPRSDDKPLRCEITPIKPMLNYGFFFQAGYTVSIPLTQYSGRRNRLTVVSRITPKNGGAKPVYLAQGLFLPPIPADAPKKDSVIETGGNFLLGEGRYDVDWILMDNSGRICRKHWTASADLHGSSRSVKTTIPPNVATDLSLRGVSLPTPEDEDVRKLRLTVLVHATPLSPRRTKLRASDEAMLLGTLSSLMGRIPTLSVRLVVFNLEQHAEIFRRDDFRLRELDEVSEAMQKVELGSVDYSVLKDKGGHLDLLAKLLNEEQNAGESKRGPSDVVIFLGPMARHLDKLPAQAINKPLGTAPRFFYFRFESFFRRNPNAGLPDAINFALKSVKGKSIVIHTPLEFSKAIDQVLKSNRC